MTYHVNEIFYTLQGEGYWTGRPAVFVRFSRCNLWTGREQDRARAVCQFCDTDFRASAKWSLPDLCEVIDDAWPDGAPNPMAVFTGGEPLLQLDSDLVRAVHERGFYTAVETNGTIADCPPVDWVCVSPKANATLRLVRGNELKLVYPQEIDPAVYGGLFFDHYWLSPMDGPDIAENTAAAVDYVLAHPGWRLNIQTHKAIGVR